MIVLDCNILHASHIRLAFSPEFFYRWCQTPLENSLKKQFLGFFSNVCVIIVAVIVA